MRETTEGGAAHFTRAKLPLYHSPLIKIRLQPSNREYMVSQGLLCAASPVFEAMLKPGFREFEEQTLTLQEESGVISIRGIDTLIRWLYLGTIDDIKYGEEYLSAGIELARLADKYNITGMESQVAQYVKEIISPDPTVFLDDKSFLTSDHIISGTFLPRGHPVRRTLTAACVRGYLQSNPNKFLQRIDGYPTFAADFLRELRLALNELGHTPRGITFKDPLNGEIMYLNKALRVDEV